ncbi:MAG: hypothetical protein UZ22_OP11002000849 [Microgenomates bacterium OLB23]|nr:MAG: hypothetical protein UZ22_OP11002000849 [Microgenomates bacterium OLB23]
MQLTITYSKLSEYYLAFSHVPGIGPYKVQQLISYFGTIQAAYGAPADQLSRIMPTRTLKEFLTFRSEKDPYSILQNLLKRDIQILTFDLPQYPECLRNIASPPLCLYIRGDMTLIAQQSIDSTTQKPHAIAVVGSRECTMYGRWLTELFTSRLASAGLTIVSGMAEGIDALAHTIALRFKTATIAVLGSGIDVVYPKYNENLYHRIIAEGGTVMSEFPPGTRVNRGLFVSRNRLISALSDGVLIIEGTSRSGTLKTAEHAGLQGRTIFLPPYNLNAEYGYTFSHLMQQGGTFVFSPDDIFEHLHIKPPALPPELTLELTPAQAELMSFIRKEVATPDELSNRLNLPITTILNRLSELEIAGYIAKNTLGEYYIC